MSEPRARRMARIAPPRLQTVGDRGRRSATWLELFYDLAFVVAISVLGGRLLADTSWAGLWSFFGYFALLWWLWASNTFYADRYDTEVQSRDHFVTATWILGGAAVAAGAIAAGLYFFDTPQPTERLIVPTATSNSASVSVVGRF